MGNALEEGEVTASITRKSASAPSKASIFGGTSKLRAPIAPRKKNNSTPNSDKAARDATVKRPPPLDSLHKPLSYDSCASEAKKTSSPILDSIRNLRIIKSFGKSSKDSRTKHALTRVCPVLCDQHLYATDAHLHKNHQHINTLQLDLNLNLY